MRTKLGYLSILIGSAALAACGDDGGGGGGDGDGEIGSYVVTGSVLDFETDSPIPSGVTVSTSGLSPAPRVSVTGADFTIEGVPPFSVFYVLGGSPPEYRNTYSTAIEVEDSDVSGIETRVVSEAYLTTLEEGFGVNPPAGTGVLIAQVQDQAGAPVAGIPAEAFEVNNAAPLDGPYFLDEALAPAPAAQSTTASGYVVFYEIEEGLVAVTAADDSGYTMVMSSAPVASTAVTLSVIDLADGDAVVVPTGVSFSADVIPIFADRGCEICHSGNGIGRDLGNLTLNGGVNVPHRELTEEVSPNHGTLRVNLGQPEQSLVLTMPSFEDPADEHPNVTFSSPADPDYLTILGWITEGARNN